MERERENFWYKLLERRICEFDHRESLLFCHLCASFSFHLVYFFSNQNQCYCCCSTVLTARWRNPFSVNGKKTNDIIVPTSIRWTSTCRLKNLGVEWETKGNHHSKKKKKRNTYTRTPHPPYSSASHLIEQIFSREWRERKWKRKEERLYWIFVRGYIESCSTTTTSSEIASINWRWCRTNTFLSIEIMMKVRVSKLKKKEKKETKFLAFESNRNVSSRNQSNILHMRFIEHSNPLIRYFVFYLGELISFELKCVCERERGGGGTFFFLQLKRVDVIELVMDFFSFSS